MDIKKRNGDSWLITVSGGYDGNGKQIRYRRTIHAETEREARQKYIIFAAQVQQKLVAPQRITLSEFFDYWVENYARHNHAPKTQQENEYLFKRVKTALGHKMLDQIEPKHLLTFYKNLQESGVKQDPNVNAKFRRKKKDEEQSRLSINTVRKYHVFLHGLLCRAVKWQFISSNPAARVGPPRAIKAVKPIYDQETMGVFLNLLKKEKLKYQVMVLFAIGLGLRRGELFGLQWKHIDFDKNTIEIIQECQYIKGRGTFIKPPKTKSSERMLSVPASGMNYTC